MIVLFQNGLPYQDLHIEKGIDCCLAQWHVNVFCVFFCDGFAEGKPHTRIPASLKPCDCDIF